MGVTNGVQNNLFYLRVVIKNATAQASSTPFKYVGSTNNHKNTLIEKCLS